MTEQPNQFDEVDRLQAQLEYVQALHAQSLQDLQQNEGKLLDRTAYNTRRKVLTEAHEQASKEITQRIEATKEATRKQLALDLLYSGNTAQEQADFAEAVRLVEDARTIEQQEALIHRALRWGDKALARALVYKFGGRPEYKAMHEILAGVDPRVKAAWDYERKHGTYKPKGASSQTWAGWRTVQRQPGAWSDPVDIPGRPAHLQPGYLREQARQRIEKMKSGG